MITFEHPQGAVGHHHLVLGNWNSQYMGQLICFFLAKAIPCIGDKHYRHQELALRVHQLLKGCFCSRYWSLSSYQHTVNVEKKPKGWQYVQHYTQAVSSRG